MKDGEEKILNLHIIDGEQKLTPIVGVWDYKEIGKILSRGKQKKQKKKKKSNGRVFVSPEIKPIGFKEFFRKYYWYKKQKNKQKCQWMLKNMFELSGITYGSPNQIIPYTKEQKKLIDFYWDNIHKSKEKNPYTTNKRKSNKMKEHVEYAHLLLEFPDIEDYNF